MQLIYMITSDKYFEIKHKNQFKIRPKFKLTARRNAFNNGQHWRTVDYWYVWTDGKCRRIRHEPSCSKKFINCKENLNLIMDENGQRQPCGLFALANTNKSMPSQSQPLPTTTNITRNECILKRHTFLRLQKRW